jgi:hypothetical protein
LSTNTLINVPIAEKNSSMACEGLVRCSKSLLGLKLQVSCMMDDSSKMLVSSSDSHRKTLIFTNGSEEV